MGCGTCLGICQCGGTRCGAVTTVPLYKTAAQATVRPIGIKPCLARVIHKVVTRQSRQAFIEYFEPQQLAMSPSGPHQLVNGLRMLGEANRSFVTLKSDIKNAFPSVSRSRILNVMTDEQQLQHLVWHAAQILAPSSALEHGGHVWGEAGERTTQGDPPAGALFSVAWHPQLRELDAKVAAVGGAARAGMDDLYVCGPPEVVYPAVEVFWAEVLEVCQLQLERSKTEIFSWGELPAGTPPGLTRAGTLLDGTFQPGFILYGIPVGTPEYVQHHLSLKVQEVAGEVEQVVDVLEGEGQAIWTIARASTVMKLDYHLSLCYPSDMEVAAREMDRLLWSMVERAAGLSIPKLEEGRGVECVTAGYGQT